MFYSAPPESHAANNSLDACVKHAIEYQGSGHHQGTTAARDAVKKEALRKTGIGYHEVVAGHTTAGELRRLVEKLVPGAN